MAARTDRSDAWYRSRSLWLDQALASPSNARLPGGVPERSPLASDTDADVVVVGGGFTGLWTALELRRRDRAMHIVVLEAEIAGFGASGRNGGWCSAFLPIGTAALASRYGLGDAHRMRSAMIATVDEVGDRVRELGIDAGYAKGGTIMFARNPGQVARQHDELASERALGVPADDLRWLDAREAADHAIVAGSRGGLYTPHCAAVHPGRLARGLAAAVEACGVTIHEHSPVVSIEQGRVRTATGSVKAPVIVRATEAYTARLAAHRRDVVPMYSLMIATEPLPSSVWDEIGLASRPTFADARHLIIYGQRTVDGRLAFGGRGAPYHFGSRIDDSFDHHDATHLALREVLVDLFPAVASAAVTHAWGGPLAVPRDWHPSVGFDRRAGLAWAGGYVGDGVATANLAGRTLADLIVGADSDLVTLPWVGHRSRRWEHEPLRWLGINSIARLPDRIDRAELAGRHPSRAAERVLDHFTGH